MSAIDKEPFPRAVLAAAAVLLTVSIAATAAGRLQKLSAPARDPLAGYAVVSGAEIRFADVADGSVAVIDARSSRQVAVLRPGEGGFVRGVMRGLAHERLRLGLGEQVPFRLVLAAGGELWLRDEGTGRVIDLNSFGTDNRASFLRLLELDRRSA